MIALHQVSFFFFPSRNAWQRGYSSEIESIRVFVFVHVYQREMHHLKDGNRQVFCLRCPMAPYIWFSKISVTYLKTVSSVFLSKHCPNYFFVSLAIRLDWRFVFLSHFGELWIQHCLEFENLLLLWLGFRVIFYFGVSDLDFRCYVL
jgi:hypothetical protein